MNVIKLIFDIYISAFYVIKDILFKNKSDIKIIDIDLSTKSEFHQTLIANSITLTPGTITVEKKGSHLRVLCLNPKSN